MLNAQTALSSARIWTTSDTNQSFKAELIGKKGDEVLFRFADGSKRRVFTRRLIAKDQKFIKDLPKFPTIPSPPEDHALGKKSKNIEHEIRDQSDFANIVFDLPALTVNSNPPTHKTEKNGSHYTGEINLVRMEYKVSKKPNIPFRLSIAEEEPGAAGDMLEASFWLAAIVAGLETRTDLAGVELNFFLSGRVDGPSAGGLICVAILTALEDEDFPNDVTFTGTVLPDGTIGLIGGLVEKIKAASDGGYKKVIIPAGIRFAEDLSNGNLVNLENLADSLNIQLIAVESINEAYAAIHGKSRSARTSYVHRPRTAKEIQEALTRSIKDSLAAGDSTLEKISLADRTKIQEEQYYKSFRDTRRGADNAFRSGQLFLAWDRATSWDLLMRSHHNLLKTRDKGKTINEMNHEADSMRSTLAHPRLIINHLSRKLTPIAAPACIPIEESLSLYASIEGLDDELKTRLDEIERTPDDELEVGITRRAMIDQETLRSAHVHLFLTHVLQDYHDHFPKEQLDIYRHLPELYFDPEQANLVEHFFYTAYQTALNTFVSEYMRDIAERYDIMQPEAINFVTALDQEVASHWSTIPNAEYWHMKLKNPALSNRQRNFLLTYVTQLYASYFADISSFIVRWGVLQMKITDTGFEYRRTIELSRMLREARKNALENIAKCHQLGIPCPQSLKEFQEAEATRDDHSVDSITVLATYWRSSLQAKSLLMLFSHQTSTSSEGIWNSEEMLTARKWLSGYLARTLHIPQHRINLYLKKIELLPAPAMANWLIKYHEQRDMAKRGVGFNIKALPLSFDP